MKHLLNKLFNKSTVLFIAGLVGVIYETTLPVAHIDQSLLILFAAMMGLPAFFPSYGPKDPKDKEKKDEEEK